MEVMIARSRPKRIGSSLPEALITGPSMLMHAA